MSARAPFFILGSRSLQKERYVVLSVFLAVFTTALVICSCRWVEVWGECYRTVRRGVFRASKIEHVDCLGIK